MARLPKPHGDQGTWAELLNEYLLVAHNPDGTARGKSIPRRSVGLGQLAVKNRRSQLTGNLVLTNDNANLVWKNITDVLRASSRVRISAANFGAKGDGKTDDTAAIQAAIDAAKDGGVVEIPRGTYMVRGLKIKKSGTTLTGEARWGTRLVRLGGTAPLIDVSGTGTMSGHLRYCTVTNLTLNGGQLPGKLLRSYYADSCTYRDVHFVNCQGVATDLVEAWDTRFTLNIWENCGTAQDPAVLLRNSKPPGKFGFSDDNTNQIHFISCRWERFRNGAVKIDGSANGSSRMLNGIFFTSCKMETSVAAGSALQIMKNSTIVFVSQLYIGVMGADAKASVPLDAIEDHGTHIFMTDVYVQWGAGVNLANSLVHVWCGGPHTYSRLSTYYPAGDPVEATVVAEPDATDVTVSSQTANCGTATKGNVSTSIVSNPSRGLKVPLDGASAFRIVSNNTRKELVKIDSTVAHFAGGKFQVEQTKGYVGINTAPYSRIAMLIQAAAEDDRGLVIIRPSDTATNHLLEFQDQAHDAQGQAFDANGRPVAVGRPPKVTPGDQVSYANPDPQVRDIAGTITAAVRHGPTAPGVVATVTFSRPYAAVPLSITINDHSSVWADLYVSARTETGFTVSTRTALRGGSILNFDYAIVA